MNLLGLPNSTLIDSHFPLLKKKGINFSSSILKPSITFKRAVNGINLNLTSKSKEERFMLKEESDHQTELNFTGNKEIEIKRSNKSNQVEY